VEVLTGLSISIMEIDKVDAKGGVMDKPTDTQQKEFLKWCGWEQKSETIYGRTVKYWHSPDKNQYSGKSRKKLYNPPELDLNFLFKHAPDIVVGIYFRYFPGGCECELTYITEAGFDTVKSWVANETGDEKKSRELSALALFWVLWQVKESE